MKSYRMIKLFLTASLFFSLTTCFGWGRSGHHIIAEIARSLMSRSTIDNVKAYLGATTFEEASVWMDEMRSEGKYEYMKPWHYINIEKGGQYAAGSGDNIVDRLNIVYNELRNKQQLGTETIHTDLLILFHLIGDLFQPLHVGYGVDRGGNTFLLTVNGKPSNLHAVWDNEIIEDEHITTAGCLEYYKNLSPAAVSDIGNMDFVGWTTENRKLLDEMYPQGHQIDDAYLQNNKVVVEKQLLFAGVKLAATLTTLFNASDDRAMAAPSTIEKIDAAEAEKYIGKRVTVCSTVFGVKELPAINFINLGARYPDSPLTIVVFAEDKANFKDGLAVYDGRHICVTGTIKEYKGKTEIIISDPKDISVE